MLVELRGPIAISQPMPAPFVAPASYGLSNGSPPFPCSRLLGSPSPSPWTALDELNLAVLLPSGPRLRLIESHPRRVSRPSGLSLRS